jgi:excinuclease UvrABC nuclease subunit
MQQTAVATANLTSQEATCWLALALTQGLGPTRIKKLVEHFGRPDRVCRPA